MIRYPEISGPPRTNSIQETCNRKSDSDICQFSYLEVPGNADVAGLGAYPSEQLRFDQDHPVARETAAQEFVGRAPQIKTKAAVIKIAEPLNDKIAVGVEIARPLLECEKIAVAVVAYLGHFQLGAGEL